MTYIPQNVQIFTAAYAGCLAGMGVSDRIISSTNPLVYAGIASVAGAFSKAVDTAWGARATTLLDVESIQSVCEAYWQDRAPLPSQANISASWWAAAALAIIAIVTAGESYFASEGITPPAIPSGGSITDFLNLSSINSQGPITQFNPIIFESEDINQNMTYNVLTGEFVPTVNGLYLVNYTLRVSVNGGPAEATWGLIEDGNSTIDRTTSSIAEVAGLAGNVYTISQSTLIELLTTHVYTIGNVSGVNGSISGVGAPSATVNMMRIA